MIQALLILAMLQVSGGPAEKEEPDEAPYRSQTFVNWLRDGKVEPVRHVRTGEITLDLWVHRGEFNPAPYLATAGVDADAFYGELLSVFEWAIPVCKKGLRKDGRHYTVVLVDKEPGSTISAALRGTWTILCEVKSWHSRLSSKDRFRRELVYVSAAHEIYHTYNYETDMGEVAYMRELSAMIWESVAFVRRYGGDGSALWQGITFFKNITRDTRIPVDGDFLTSYKAPPVRVLAYLIADRVIKRKGLDGVEDLARRLLEDPRNGRFSLDRTLEESGFPFRSSDVISDLRRMIQDPNWRPIESAKPPAVGSPDAHVVAALNFLRRGVLDFSRNVHVGLQGLIATALARTRTQGSNRQRGPR